MLRKTWITPTKEVVIESDQTYINYLNDIKAYEKIISTKYIDKKLGLHQSLDKLPIEIQTFILETSITDEFKLEYPNLQREIESYSFS